MGLISLTKREHEIASQVATGASNKEIARRLTISTKTVKNTVTKVFLKTGTESRTGLAIHWVRRAYQDPVEQKQFHRFAYRLVGVRGAVGEHLATNDFAPLTKREKEIATLVATGASNKEIARQLAVSQKTVKNMLTHVFVKTQTRSRTELAIRLVRAEYARNTVTVVAG